VQFVVLREVGDIIEKGGQGEDVMVAIEIRSSQVVGLSGCTSYIPKKIILNNLRCNNNMNKNPIFGGDIGVIKHLPDGSIGPCGTKLSGEYSLILASFNKEHDSWNYGWQSNRWNLEMHIVEVVSDYYM
jgi:hypothetical protein